MEKNTPDITIDQQLLRRALVGITVLPEDALKSYVASFNMWSHVFGIDKNHRRVAMYLAQTLYESNYLRATEENLNYSAEGLLKTWPKRFTREKAEYYARQPQKIGNYVYADRMGNGNEQSGDGYRYRGRGYIMLTGRYNYEQFKKYDLCTEDVVKNPDYVGKYPLNQVAAMWFWEKNNLNALADMDDVDKVTGVINGGKLGLNTRQLLYRRFSKEFGIKKL
jgi:predicted chitinase